VQLKFKCPNCGKEISEKYADSTGLCFECYSKEKDSVKTGACADCGKHIDEKYDYCYSCSQERKEAQEEAKEKEDYFEEHIEEKLPIQETNWEVRQVYYNRRKEHYEDYINSPAWTKKRTEKMIEAKYKCEECGASRMDIYLQVHHLSYDRLGREEMRDLLVLCENCHKKKHHQLAKIREEYFSRK
jgi:5-methylcytosine-specific restriction endonuclease McrA